MLRFPNATGRFVVAAAAAAAAAAAVVVVVVVVVFSFQFFFVSLLVTGFCCFLSINRVLLRFFFGSLDFRSFLRDYQAKSCWPRWVAVYE